MREDLQYFVETFVLKAKQERFRSFATRPDLFVEHLDELERAVNSRCRLVELNTESAVRDVSVGAGVYFDRWNLGSQLSPAEAAEAGGDGLLICQDSRVAFYFHHEGWVWICEAD